MIDITALRERLNARTAEIGEDPDLLAEARSEMRAEQRYS